MSERERKVFWHWSNENHRPGDKDHRASGNPLRHGRAWLHFPRGVLSAEWVLGKFDFNVGLTVDPDECDVTWRVVLPGIGLYLSVESGRLQPLFKRLGMDWETRKARGGPHAHDISRALGVRIFDWAVWWDCWAPDDWHSDDSKWRRGCVHLDDTLLGRHRFFEEVIATRAIKVPMPEGTYDATAKLTRCTWKRPRWPTPIVRMSCSIDIPKGIPVPGKGENSWDCGPDATYGMSCRASTVEEGIGQLVASTLRTRQQRAGTHEYTERPKAEQEAAS